MGLLNKIFGRRPAPRGVANAPFYQMLSSYTPSFTTLGGQIYESQMIRAAIDARARNIAKLEVKVLGSAKPKLKTKLKTGPNEWQTWAQFLYQASTILDVDNTLFIVPVLDEYGEASGVFPIRPSRCEVVEYEGRPWVRYHFRTGTTAAMELDRCGIMTKFQLDHELFGESNAALLPTMDMVYIQDQVVAESAKNSAVFKFIATMSNFANDDDLAEERKNFSRNNLQGEGGLLLFPNTYKDIREVTTKPYTVDPKEREQIRTSVCEYFGVSPEILMNKAIGNEWDAFYEGAIEPWSVQFAEVMTKMLYTERERAAGASIMATSDRLQYMSVSDKVNLAEKLGDRGAITIDEIRHMLQMAPLPDNAGQHAPIRGEYYFVEGKANGKKGDAADDGGTEKKD